MPVGLCVVNSLVDQVRFFVATALPSFIRVELRYVLVGS